MKIELTLVELSLMKRLLNDKKLDDKFAAQTLDKHSMSSTALDNLIKKVERGLKAEE